MIQNIYLNRHGHVNLPVNAQGERLVHKVDVTLNDQGIQSSSSMHFLTDTYYSDFKQYFSGTLPRVIDSAIVHRLRSHESAFPQNQVEELQYLGEKFKVLLKQNNQGETPKEIDSEIVDLRRTLCDRLDINLDTRLNEISNPGAMFAGTLKQKWEELHLHEKPPKEGIEKTMDFLKYIINASGEIQSDSTTLISSYVFSHRNNILVALFLLENWGNSDATFPTLLELKKHTL